MPLKYRRLLYIFFIILFFAITPLVIFYAAGYKFSPAGIKLQKTGSFIFATEPEGAKIYVNGELQQAFLKKYFSQGESYVRTPAKIKNILPGEYEVKFELDGYLSWQKKLAIYPGASTYAEDVYLFKNELPTIVVNKAIDNINQSPDRNKLTILSDEKIYILNLENEKLIDFAINNVNNTHAWSASSKKILINQKVINTENSNIINLNDYSKINNLKYKWDFTSDDRLFFKTNNTINSFSLATKNIKPILTDQLFFDYLIKDNVVYLLSAENQSMSLTIKEINTDKVINTINLPSSAGYQFINPARTLINLYDQNHKILYLIDPQASFYSPLREVINNVVNTYWVDNEKMLYANDFEIWLYNLRQNKKTLLTRISKKITGIIWHPSNNYIIYSTENSINTIELDEREKRSIIQIIELDEISNLAINQKGDMLYFYARIGNQQGLYKLAIH